MDRLIMTDLKFERIDEYIFAPFNTFLYINRDKMRFINSHELKQKLLTELNSETTSLRIKNRNIRWKLEGAEDFKLSKGVFIPPGEDNSFVMAEVTGNQQNENSIPISENLSSMFPENSLSFSNIRFYFHESGVATCSVRVKVQAKEKITVLQLEEVSEAINVVYKQYFEDISFKLAELYVKKIQELEIPHYQFDFLPTIYDVDKSKHFLPWTHRIYHIQNDELFEMENPGEPFRFLVTPARQMTISDHSIYDNRWIYFGWGHSLIFTSSQEQMYSQTNRPVYDYVRLVEIAQAKWQFLDILTDIVEFALASFNRHYKKLRKKEIEKAVIEIRNFENAVDRLLSQLKGVKITFDTEKRKLLDELNERWLTEKMIENLQEKMRLTNELLNQLYERQKEQREDALNTIALLFTTIGIVEVIGLTYEILNASNSLSPILQMMILIFGLFLTGMIINLYLKYSESR